MKVLGISGSLRRESHNTKLLKAAGELFEAAGAEFEIYPDLKLVPPYDGAPAEVSFAGVWGAEDPDLADSEGSRWMYGGVAKIQ